jgi:adenylate cyclase
MKDVFVIQDDIAHSIVKALQVTLTPQERRAMQFVATSDPEAYDYYLRGRNYMYSMARRDYEHAIRMFEQAIAVDS